MANKKFTKRALFGSVIALILCCAMLVGTTFAWFTDSASTNVNTIQSGTLDIDLVDAEGDSVVGEPLEFANVNGSTEILWEPGCTFNLPTVYVVNKGNLALKYNLVISGVDGDAKLLEAIEWTINGDEYAPQEDVSLAVGAKNEVKIAAHMKEEAGNEYQDLTITGIAIEIVATQDTVEYDSIDNQYDAEAEYPDAPAASEPSEPSEEPSEPVVDPVPGNRIDPSWAGEKDDEGWAVVRDANLTEKITVHEMNTAFYDCTINGLKLSGDSGAPFIWLENVNLTGKITTDDTLISYIAFVNVTMNGEPITTEDEAINCIEGDYYYIYTVE